MGGVVGALAGKGATITKRERDANAGRFGTAFQISGCDSPHIQSLENRKQLVSHRFGSRGHSRDISVFRPLANPYAHPLRSSFVTSSFERRVLRGHGSICTVAASPSEG